MGRTSGKGQVSLDRVLALRDLCTSFATTATEIGKKIIAELNLPDEEKTIVPITRYAISFFILKFNFLNRKVCGFAGGSKYCHQSIFFKFPLDENNLYGGPEGLMKVSNFKRTKELISLIVLSLFFLSFFSFVRFSLLFLFHFLVGQINFFIQIFRHVDMR